MTDLHELCKGILPNHIINHILSFRQTHPAAELVRTHHAEIKYKVEQYITLTHWKTFMELATYDCHFRHTLFAKCIFYFLEGTNYDELMKYNSRVITDYDAIYVFYGGEDCSISNMDVHVITNIWRW